MTDEELFEAAMKIQPPEDRLPFLREHSKDDSQYRNVVELVSVADESEPLLDEIDALGATATFQLSVDLAKSGTRIGDYKLLQKIGSGGFGDVYMAQQNDPNRIVALKVIRPGWIRKRSLPGLRPNGKSWR